MLTPCSYGRALWRSSSCPMKACAFSGEIFVPGGGSPMMRKDCSNLCGICPGTGGETPSRSARVGDRSPASSEAFCGANALGWRAHLPPRSGATRLRRCHPTSTRGPTTAPLPRLPPTVWRTERAPLTLGPTATYKTRTASSKTAVATTTSMFRRFCRPSTPGYCVTHPGPRRVHPPPPRSNQTARPTCRDRLLR